MVAKKAKKISNAHDSMEAQDIMSRVETSEKEKDQKKQIQLLKIEKREAEKEIFYRCKIKCVCKGIYVASKLRECSVCHSILRSVCSKATCVIDNR